MNIESTYKRRILLSGYVCLIIFVTGFTQTRINPFEIKPRLKSMNIVDTFTPVIDTMPKEGINNFPSDIDSTVGGNDVLNKEDLNPFEVDHIPVRKSAIAKRTEKLQTQAEGTQSSNGFLFWFLLFTCTILAVVINMKTKALGLVTRSIFNENMLKLFHREESVKISPYLFLLYLIFSVNLAVFVYLAFTYFGGSRGILTFMYIVLGVIAAYSLKHISLILFGNIFGVSKNTQLYGFSIMIFNQFAGLILIPLNFLFAFGPIELKGIILWISLIMLSVLLFLRTIRGIFIVSEYLTNRFFQIIIYLCAFEVAPVLIFIKTLMNLNR